MKKLFAISFILLLAGGGCLSLGNKADQQQEANQVTGAWWLAIDLPEGWGMYPYYPQSSQDALDSSAVSREMEDVVIQSSTLPIALDAEGSEYTYVRVFRYDPRTSVPADSEDLGGGFYKRVRDDGSVAYYFVGQNGKYKFVVEQQGRSLDEAEQVILTSKEVTAL